MSWESDIEKLEKKMDLIGAQVVQLRIDVAELKIKSGLIGGFIGSLVTVGATVLVEFFKK